MLYYIYTYPAQEPEPIPTVRIQIRNTDCKLVNPSLKELSLPKILVALFL
jgi:hypothetical protein